MALALLAILGCLIFMGSLALLLVVVYCFLLLVSCCISVSFSFVFGSFGLTVLIFRDSGFLVSVADFSFMFCCCYWDCFGVVVVSIFRWLFHVAVLRYWMIFFFDFLVRAFQDLSAYRLFLGLGG